MNFIKTRDIFMQACMHSPDLHEMTDEERSHLQRHLLKMYKEIEAVCVKHDLTIMMAYGSLLGAVRHGGFIPWDDDLDVIMPRRDYELLINQYADELPEYLKVYAPNCKKNKARTRFAKVVDVRTKFIMADEDDVNDPSQGIFVDIFPIEYLENSPLKNRILRYVAMVMMYIGTSVGQYKAHNQLYRELMSTLVATRINYWLRNTLGFCFSFLSFQQWMNMIDKFCRCDKESNFMGDAICDYKWKPMPKDIYLPAIEGAFENTRVFLPHDPIANLVETFGDWQRIPPPEERWQHFISKIEFCDD